MVLPPRARTSYWPRTLPRTLVKTSVLALGVLLWLLYFYSGSYAYDRRTSGGGDSKRADGFILRRPTVPLFEGPVEDDPSPPSGPKATAEPLTGSKATMMRSTGPSLTTAKPTAPKVKAVRRGDYIVMEKLLVSRLRFGYNQSVTITTHATYELLDNLIYLSQRWQGPISVAVYAPHDDFKTALLYALWLRRCHSSVRDFVTFHFVYPAPQPAAPSKDPSRRSSSTAPDAVQKKSGPSSETSLPESTKVFRESPETSKSFQNSNQMLADASEAFRKPSTSSSEPSKLILNSSDVSSAFRNATNESIAVVKKTSTNSHTSTSQNALQNSADVVRYSPPDTPSKTAESSKVSDTSESSKALQKPLETLQYSVDAFQKSLGPFQEPFEGYVKQAEDIIGRYGEGSAAAATVPSCDSTSFQLPRSYRHRHGLPYPINVCRNVARLNAETHFVLASDIELYPSADVVPAFLEFGRRTGLVQRPGWEATERTPASSLASFFLRGPAAAASVHPLRRVFVLPIFEVDRSVGTVPATKAALVELYRRKKAVYFHKHVCSFCNIIPRLNRWLVAPVPRGRHLGVFMSIKRHKPFNRWEPIYIGTNNEPLYDERLSWEGQQDKMTQMYELCLLNYDLAILDNAFLVHRPGIKTKNATEYRLKSRFIAQNNKIYKNIIANLEKKHGTNSWCK